jgi:UDP-glucose 4-epimerase
VQTNGTYLVTGGAGFIGSHVVEALLAAGHSVRVLDDLSTGHARNVPTDSRVKFIQGSITDPIAVSDAGDGIQGIFHLAAIASVPRCTEQLADAHEVNLTGTLRLFELARAAHVPIVYTSSAAVYGDNPAQPLLESAEKHPLSAYGLDKLGCEQHAGLLKAQGIHSVGIRPFNVYGPRQDPSSPYSGVISLFCARLQSGAAISLFGDGGQTRDFIQVRDIAQHFLAAMHYLQQGGASTVVNGCTGKTITIAELAKLLMQISGRTVEVQHAPPRVGDIRHSCGDAGYANSTLGLSGRVVLAEGLSELWQYLSTEGQS